MPFPFLARAKKASPPPSSAALRPERGAASIVFGSQIAIGCDGRSSKQQTRRMTMATIGTFTKTDERPDEDAKCQTLRPNR